MSNNPISVSFRSRATREQSRTDEVPATQRGARIRPRCILAFLLTLVASATEASGACSADGRPEVRSDHTYYGPGETLES